MITNLIVGDWSDDGHGKTSTIIIEHNMPTLELLQRAYKEGCIKLNIRGVAYDYEAKPPAFRDIILKDVMANQANDYENSSISRELVEALAANGIVYSDHEDSFWIDREGSYFEGPEGFARVWMQIAELGRPGLKWFIVENAHINIGGYGLFA